MRHSFVAGVLMLVALLVAGLSATAAEGERQITLSTPVSGVIRAIHVSAGNRVRSGEPLIEFDDRTFRARVSRARAQLNKLRVMRDEARREHQRTLELYNRRVISKHDLQLSEIAAAGAEADYISARSELTEAEVALEYATVRAPADGEVVEVLVNPGETIVNRQQVTPMLILRRDGLAPHGN